MIGMVAGAVQKATVRRRVGPARWQGVLLYFMKKQNSCKNIIGRKINRLEPRKASTPPKPVILIMMEKDWGQSFQLAVRTGSHRSGYLCSRVLILICIRGRGGIIGELEENREHSWN